MLPPNARGNVSWIAPAGSYTIEDKVIEVEFGGAKKVRGGGGSWVLLWGLHGSHFSGERAGPACKCWPVRVPKELR